MLNLSSNWINGTKVVSIAGGDDEEEKPILKSETSKQELSF